MRRRGARGHDVHYGIITPPVSGHIHPFGALGRELIARGHRVTLLHMEDVRASAIQEGVEFAPLGESDHPPESLGRSLTELGRRKGLGALRFTIEAVCRTTEMICRDAPAVLEARGIDRLLVDQTEPAGGTVADHLGIPFVTICNALALNREPCMPPPFTGWRYTSSTWGRVKNSVGYAVYDRLMAPVMQVVADWRKRWGLVRLRSADDSFSTLAQISQMTRGFDFPRERLPQCFTYSGPLRRPGLKPAPFPWEELDGRPLIYASLGTLQHGKREIFARMAEACAPLDVQLVIAHNGGLSESDVATLAGRPVAVSFAPQREVLKRAALTLTHAGLNTVLDSLAASAPVIAMPITYEQPAIAARLVASGAGLSIAPIRVTAASIRAGILRILRDTSYRDHAQSAADEICEAGGVERAGSVIEGIG
jgi:zeaxanthin glucosyltransferase